MQKIEKILLISSTFPASERDDVPGFVKDQVLALKKLHPETEFVVLAPHDSLSNTKKETKYKEYIERRFHYFWPFSLEKLAGHGIMPTLKKNKLYFLMIPFLFLFEVLSLFILVRKFRPDYIYAHWFTPQGISAGIVSLISGTKFVFTSHSSDVIILKKFPILGSAMVRFFSKHAKAITVVSRRSYEKLRSFFSQKDWKTISAKVKIIPMGVYLAPNLSTGALSKDKKSNIAFIGRFVEKKGIHYLIPAFEKYFSADPESELKIAGDGPWKEKLLSLANSVNLPQDKIQFLGYLQGEKKQNFLQESDIIVVPSIISKDGDSEGLPVVLLEGMASGKICIATFESGADDIIEDGINGFLIPEKDPDAISNSLLKIKSLSLEQKTNIQRKAVETAANYEWSTVAEQHWDFLFHDEH
ncbi:glycosyltransferase [Leptospira johnsonii]|uniref:Glycosyltransferase, group 1 family protein n=1 Tax=Leptospira johnsonii TaxID=1917820 RepID=A0A2P2D2P3_9LEPT|nr:glycosyltransferase [Leptospira johnsonii]GBF38923.1 glycosyltransferase, group 1 family protein [Leptospira johnsonii]